MHQKSSSSQHSESHLNDAREYWWNDDYLELLASRLELNQCDSLADIGCGKGMMAFKLAPFLAENAKVFGLDMEPKYIKGATKAIKKQSKNSTAEFEFVSGSAYDLPYEDASMDVTLCQTLLIHLNDPLQAIKEMKRITKPGGWIVGFEPNNMVQHLLFDRYRDTDYEVEDILRVLEIRLRIEKGKKAEGKGFNSLGDVLPDLFLQAGLEETQVWLSDKALQIIPPYDTREKRFRVGQMITWLEDGSGGLGYEENVTYYIAGGGKKKDFDAYWQTVLAYKDVLLRNLKQQKHITAGGGVMYITAARVPEEE